IVDVVALVDLSQDLVGVGGKDQRKGMQRLRLRHTYARDASDRRGIQTAAQRRADRERAAQPRLHAFRKAIAKRLRIFLIGRKLQLSLRVQPPVTRDPQIAAAYYHRRPGRQAINILVERDRPIVEEVGEEIQDPQFIQADGNFRQRAE